MRRLLSLLLLLSFISFESSGQQYPGIPLETLLPESQQEQMGLRNLTDEEREKLRIFIIDLFLRGVEEGRKEAPPSRQAQIVESRVDGTFNGWDGDTIVVLVNGQAWQQSEYHYEYGYEYRPEVLVYRSGGGYKMWIFGTDEPVGVMQLVARES